jgi:hypothetical protein
LNVESPSEHSQADVGAQDRFQWSDDRVWTI